jgi:hypothetical protein
MNDISDSSPLFTTEPSLPKSTPPSLAELQVRVRRLQASRRRRTAMTALSCIFALAGVFLSQTWNRNQSPDKSSPQITGVVGPVNSTETPRREAMPDEHSFRVFARVHQPVPIFHQAEGTDLLRHVGWIASEEMVPVNMKGVPDEQRQSIEAVLSGADQAVWTSL